MVRIFSLLVMFTLFFSSKQLLAKYSAVPESVQHESYYYMINPSFKSKIYRLMIRLAGIKTKVQRNFKSGDFSAAHSAAPIPERMKAYCDITTRMSATNRTIWKIKRKDSRPKRFLFFIHGGSFAANITPYDWNLLGKIVQQTDVGIVVPDYPLTPTYTYQDVFDTIVPEYSALIDSVGGDNVVLAGFSVGGGIALSIAQYALKHQLKQPSQIILLSPMLDATLQNPEIPAVDQDDPYIDVTGLKMAVSNYAAGTSIDDYRISPLYGPLEGLAPIHLFIGTHEVLWPDARKFKTMAKNKNTPITYHEYNRMYHGWVFLDMPEARDVFNKLMRILADE